MAVSMASSADGAFKFKIVVQTSQAETAVLRVLGPDGSGIRSLYSGKIPAGRWGFAWDGRKDDQSPAGPGRYKIELDYRGQSLAKFVELEQTTNLARDWPR